LDETVNSDTALEAKLRVVFSANSKVDRARDKLVNGVDKRCAVLPAPPQLYCLGIRLFASSTAPGASEL
jgi:hypothetical protein